MFIVVQNLHLRAGVPRLFEVLADTVHDAAVAARRDPPLEFQFKIVVLLFRHQISAALSRDRFKRPVFHLPRLVGKLVLLETAPMVSRLSVKKNLPFAGLGGRALAVEGNATAGKDGCNETTGEENFDLNSHN